MIRCLPAVAALLAVGAAPGAGAAVLRAGTGQEFPTAAAAVAAAKDGDTVHLVAGSYFECATVRRRNLVLEGEGETTVLTDRTCDGKALLVVQADGLTVRNLVLARARVPDRNGAGIRLEAQGLTLDRVVFDNDEVGVLAQAGGPGTVLVRDCAFRNGGVAGERPTSALSVGAVGLLRVEGSRFEGFRGGQVTTAAKRTEVVDTVLSGGVEPDGGALVTAYGPLSMQGNTLEVGPNPLPRGAAVVAAGAVAVLDGNRLANTTGQPAILLLNWTGGTPKLSGNVVGAGDMEDSTDGAWRRRAGMVARDVIGGARDAARDARGMAKRLLGR